MSRARQKYRLSDSFHRLFVANSVLFVTIAFDLGIMLGRRTGAALLGRKVRNPVSTLADRVATLAPSSVSSLVPDLLPSKPSGSRRKSSGKKRAAD